MEASACAIIRARRAIHGASTFKITDKANLPRHRIHRVSLTGFLVDVGVPGYTISKDSSG